MRNGLWPISYSNFPFQLLFLTDAMPTSGDSDGAGAVAVGCSSPTDDCKMILVKLRIFTMFPSRRSNAKKGEVSPSYSNHVKLAGEWGDDSDEILTRCNPDLFEVCINKPSNFSSDIQSVKTYVIK
jgi:hypothetical protein